jgi:putative transposase
MIAFIDDHREAHGVEPICKVLPIAPSTYHDHVAKRADLSRLSARAKRDAALKDEVRRVFEANFPRLRRSQGLAAVAERGLRCGKMHGGALGAGDGPRGHHPRQTGANHGERQGSAMPSRSRQSPVRCPGAEHALGLRLHFRTWTGFVYVAFVIDTYARRIVGWR